MPKLLFMKAEGATEFTADGDFVNVVEDDAVFVDNLSGPMDVIDCTNVTYEDVRLLVLNKKDSELHYPMRAHYAGTITQQNRDDLVDAGVDNAATLAIIDNIVLLKDPI